MTTRIDVQRLPSDVRELIEAGEELVITRDGNAIATVMPTAEAFDIGPGPDESYDGVTVVATAMKLSREARTALSEQLGPDYIVLDMHAAPVTADVVLVPPSSPQLVGALREKYPKARIVVAEIEDPVLGIRYEGPVRRLIDAGAETYLASTTVSTLARQLDHTVQQQRKQLGGARLEIEA